MKQKKESPAKWQGLKINNSKGSKKSINATGTQKESFASTGKLRATEQQEARRFFILRPNLAFSRADLGEALNLPINHITRIVYELMESGFLRVVGKGRNPRTEKRVEMLQLSEAEALNLSEGGDTLPPQPQKEVNHG